MTADQLIRNLAAVNPGFFIIAAALLAAVAKDTVVRAIALIGGPIAAAKLSRNRLYRSRSAWPPLTVRCHRPVS